MTCTFPRLFRRPRPAAPIAALLLAVLMAWAPPVAAAPGGSVQDFRLPPGPGSAPQQEQPPQGPVAPDVPASREVLRPAPAPTAPATPGPGASPRIVLPPVPAPSARPRSGDRAAAPGAAPPSPAASDAPPGETAVPQPAGDGAGPAAAATPGPLPTQPAADAAGESGAGWLWPLAALLVAAGLVAAGLMVGIRARRRRGAGAPTAAPAGERPVPARPLPQPASPPPPEPDRGPLAIELEPLRLTLTLMNATLAYRLVVTNRGPGPVAALAIGIDMIAAHASLGREQQLAGPGEDAVRLATIERLAPGESRTVAGEYRLPLARVMPVRQGPAALLLPLARIRVESAGAAPTIRTFVVALPPGQPGARLQPIRLDLGPRIYSTLAARAFA